MEKGIPVIQISDFRPAPKSAWQMFKDRIKIIFCPRKVVKDVQRLPKNAG